MSWEIVFTKQAQRDSKKLVNTGLKKKAQVLLKVIAEDPFQNPPSYEKLIGDLAGAYSRRALPEAMQSVAVPLWSQPLPKDDRLPIPFFNTWCLQIQ